jgi:anti-anti-sigma regulatory factor
MNTPTVITMAGRVDVHRVAELRSQAQNSAAAGIIVDASAIEFIDNHALDVFGELGASIAAPSDVVRVTLELTRRQIPVYPTEAAAIAATFQVAA